MDCPRSEMNSQGSLSVLSARYRLIARSSSPSIGRSVLSEFFPRRIANASLFEIELVQPHRYRLRNAQGVAVHHEEQQMIANAVTTVLRGIEQPLDLGFIKVCWCVMKRAACSN